MGNEEECCRKGFAASALDSIKRLAQDPSMSSEDTVVTRLGICEECEHYDGLKCDQCGCVMPVKVRFRNMKCPLNKWVEES